MTTLMLSFLLLILVGLGIVMGAKLKEGFETQQTPPAMSPALANMIATPLFVAELKPVPNVDKLARDKDAADAANAASLKAERECPQHECPKCPDCKKCPECPDMSKYIRMDEVPCWNCTLP
jgi:hypothetical protein